MAQAVAIVLILVFLILNVISLAYINGKIKQDWFLGSLAFCTLAVLGLFAVLASLAA